jgi:hypothetical protein
MTHFRDFFERYVAAHANRELRRLMASYSILNFSTSAVSLFEPIYLYSLGFSLSQILLFYLAVYVGYFFLLPIGAKFTYHLGLHHAMLLSSPFLVVYYLSLYAIKFHWLFIILAIFSLILQKILYWPAFHSEVVNFGSDGERGKEISTLSSLSYLSAFLGPAFGGVMIAAIGFPALFAVAAMLIIASNIPLITLPEIRRVADFNYFAAMKRLVEPGMRRFTLAMFGYGEELILMVIWPIYIFLVLKGYAATGAVVSLSLILSTVAILYIGRLSDLRGCRGLLKTGVIFTAASWIGRLFLRTNLGIFGADGFYRVARNLLGIPLASLVYARARAGQVMETIIAFEMALAVGKILAAGAGIAVLALFQQNFSALFILAGVMTAFYALYPRESK